MSDIIKIANAFHNRAVEYDKHISVQRRVVSNLAGFVETQLDAPPASILDVGSGTGTLLCNLKRRYPEAYLCGLDLAYNMSLRTAEKLDGECLSVNGDAENIPFRTGSFDLLVSTSALQWANSLSRCLHEFKRVLKPGGTFCIAFFTEGTLAELQGCFRDVVCGEGVRRDELTDRLHRFRSLDEVRAMLDGMDLERVILGCEAEVDWYEDVAPLLRSIKNIGAGPIGGGSSAGLGWRGIIGRLSELYRERYGMNGKIPATYQVLYLCARSPLK